MKYANNIDGTSHSRLIPFSIVASINTLFPLLISTTFSVRHSLWNDLSILKININEFWKNFICLTLSKVFSESTTAIYDDLSIIMPRDSFLGLSDLSETELIFRIGFRLFLNQLFYELSVLIFSIKI